MSNDSDSFCPGVISVLEIEVFTVRCIVSLRTGASDCVERKIAAIRLSVRTAQRYLTC